MPAVETFYDVSLRLLSEQMDRVDKLDAKLAAVFSASAAILPIFGALLALFGNTRPAAAVGLYVAGIAVYAVLLLLASLAFRISEWSFRPDLST